MSEQQSQAPSATLSTNDGVSRLVLAGDWTVLNLERLPIAKLMVLAGAGPVRVDGSGIGRLDTAGAALLRLLVARYEAANTPVEIEALPDVAANLFTFVTERHALTADSAPARRPAANPVESVGRWAAGIAAAFAAPVAIIGRIAWFVVFRSWHWKRLRVREIVAAVDQSGFRAVPLVALLSLLLGMVVAYQGGVQLAAYGAGTFLLEMTALTMWRELAPLITAIIVAGRSGAAYAAELATMCVNDEIDALATIGVDTTELLVLPRILGLTVSVTLLVVAADVMSLLGGLIAATAFFGYEAAALLQRLPEALGTTALLIGLMKAPLFGALIGLVACAQGLTARGGADAVGRHTTDSVVQAIFLVVVCDAVISLILSAFGI